MANVLFVIAPEGFRDEELFIPKAELEKCGHKTWVASNKLGKCLGSRGGSAGAELLLKDVNTKDFDAIIFVGGGGSRVFFNDPNALNIANEFNKEEKIVAAICVAPVILANADLLKGKNATVFESEVEAIKSKGANYTGLGVTVDGNIVTGDSPKSAQAFGEKLCELLG